MYIAPSPNRISRFWSYLPVRLLITKRRSLIRVLKRVSLPLPQLLLFLGHHVFRKLILAVLFLELADEPRIPQITCNPQILAAAHQRIRFAAFRRSRDPVDVKILLFATSD